MKHKFVDVNHASIMQITNGTDIGNGVIVEAGAIIAKDVLDYVVVAEVPTRIIKY